MSSDLGTSEKLPSETTSGKKTESVTFRSSVSKNTKKTPSKIVSVSDEPAVSKDSIRDHKRNLPSNQSSKSSLPESKERSLASLATSTPVVEWGGDALQDVQDDAFAELFLTMQKGYPSTIHENSFLRSLLRWKRLKPEVNLKILAPAGNPMKGVIFYIADTKTLNGSVYAPNEEAKEALNTALRTSRRNILQSYEMVLLTCMRDINYEAIQDLTPHSGGWGISKDTVFWMPWFRARNVVLHLPDNVSVGDLERKHAEIIDNCWPHRYPGSAELTAQMIEINGGVGIFREEKLLAWAILWFYGGIGAVQTINEEKRKGYGRAVVESLVKKMGKMQLDIHLNVIGGNFIGLEFFKSVGFEVLHTSTWAILPCPPRLKPQRSDADGSLPDEENKGTHSKTGSQITGYSSVISK